MRRFSLVAALLLAPTIASAQMQAVNPERNKAFQVWGGIMFPAFGYQTYVDDLGWNAGAAFIVKPRPGFHVRLEGEYSWIGFQYITGEAAVYGGGIGAGRSVTNQGATSEGYFVAGLYNTHVCGGANCATSRDELQFGTKLGFNVAVGRGKVRPMLNIYWLYTWGSPYVSIIPITVGLRF